MAEIIETEQTQQRGMLRTWDWSLSKIANKAKQQQRTEIAGKNQELKRDQT